MNETKNNLLIRLLQVSSNSRLQIILKFFIFLFGIFRSFEFIFKNEIDIVWIFPVRHLPKIVLKLLKKRSKLLIGHISSTLPRESWLKEYDFLFSSHPEFISKWKSRNFKTFLFKTGFTPSHIKLKSYPNRTIELVFIGSLTEEHTKRISILEKLCTEFNILVFSPDTVDKNIYPNLFQKMQPALWGHKYLETLTNSKIFINIHADFSQFYSANTKLIEATSSGCLLLTEDTENKFEYFNDDEVVFYKSYDDLVKKIQFYLNNQKIAEKLARKGYERVVKEHSYRSRIIEILPILRLELQKKEAR